MRCPGQDMRFWRPGDIFQIPCPKCGTTVEFFKDEVRRKCRCGHEIVNPKMDFGCAQWCQYAEQCVGAISDEAKARQKAEQKDLLKETLKWCETMKGHSALTLRMTKRSLNFESDNLYSSWQHGMELLAHVWGSEEAKEGMEAFLAGRKPDFQRFRLRDKRELAQYLDGCERDLNAPPSMRRKAKS